MLRAFNGFMQLERTTPEVLVAERSNGKRVCPAGPVIDAFVRIESKSANKRHGNHEGEFDLLHGCGLYCSGFESFPEKLFDELWSREERSGDSETELFAMRCKSLKIFGHYSVIGFETRWLEW